MANREFTALQHKVDELIKLCLQLNEENKALKARETALMLERNRLSEKHELARTRVEAMASRLKSLEQSQ